MSGTSKQVVRNTIHNSVLYIIVSFKFKDQPRFSQSLATARDVDQDTDLSHIVNIMFNTIPFGQKFIYCLGKLDITEQIIPITVACK
jgi:hypothetical protein